MDKNLITLQEAVNDGKTIHLYYDEMAGMYVGYGFSAYYSTLATEPYTSSPEALPYTSYSEELQMPVALLRRECVFYLRQRLRKVEHRPQGYYRFETSQVIGEAGYQRWAGQLRERHLANLQLSEFNNFFV